MSWARTKKQIKREKKREKRETGGEKEKVGSWQCSTAHHCCVGADLCIAKQPSKQS